ncbi:MAG TPA: GH25 family lysozyme [Micromonosporaceae bacterium]
MAHPTSSRHGPTRRLGRRIMALAAIGALVALAAGPVAAAPSGLPGLTAARWQGTINWTSVQNAGIQFAYIRATEGTGYKDPSFNSNYPAAYYAGVIRGAYHLARPDLSNGTVQADYFVNNGGRWSADNLTLPGAVGLEWNPYGATCYGLTTTQMRQWITDFYNRYKARTGRDIVIHTTANWWNRCTGSWTGMATKSPLWIAHYTTAGGPALPAGWSSTTWTFWQYTGTGTVTGVAGAVDGSVFNGSRSRLLALANNTP